MSWTRRVLEIAAGSEKPDLGRLRAAVPEILARARAERVPESTWDALLPVGRRWLPGLAAAAASLALAAFLLQPSPSEGWETSLVAEDAISEALVGTELP